MALTNDRKQNEEAMRQVIELYKLEKKYKEIKKSYEQKKTKLTTAIKNFMYIHKGIHDGFEFNAKRNEEQDCIFSVKKIEPASIVWDADKLEMKLTKAQRQEVINKTYFIEDIDGLVKYLKSCGVNPKRFKHYLRIEKSVDVGALEQLDAVGAIDREELEDCYTTVTKSSYLRVNMTMEDEE